MGWFFSSRSSCQIQSWSWRGLLGLEASVPNGSVCLNLFIMHIWHLMLQARSVVCSLQKSLIWPFVFVTQALWAANGSVVVYPCHALIIAIALDTGKQRFFAGHTDKVIFVSSVLFFHMSIKIQERLKNTPVLLNLGIFRCYILQLCSAPASIASRQEWAPGCRSLVCTRSLHDVRWMHFETWVELEAVFQYLINFTQLLWKRGCGTCGHPDWGTAPSSPDHWLC